MHRFFCQLGIPALLLSHKPLTNTFLLVKKRLAYVYLFPYTKMYIQDIQTFDNGNAYKKKLTIDILTKFPVIFRERTHLKILHIALANIKLL